MKNNLQTLYPLTHNGILKEFGYFKHILIDIL